METTGTVVAIEPGTFINPEALKEAGWENTGSKFSNYEIWRKKNGGKERILYDPQDQVISRVYDI